MEHQEQTFQITVQINEGLEPATLTVEAKEDKSMSQNYEMTYKITRDKDSDTLAVLAADARDHHWQILEGDLQQEAVDLIGAAIEARYAQ